MIKAQPNPSTILGRAMRGIAIGGIGSLPKRLASFIRMLWRQTTFRPYVITKRIAGEELKFNIVDFWAEDWYAVNNILKEGDWVKSQLDTGDVFVDCGSHHGLFTLLASKWVGSDGSVIAIEALPNNAATVKKNLDLNGFANARVYNVAASSSEGTVYVERKKYRFLNDSNGTVRSTPHEGTVDVPCKTIDSLLNGKTVKLLKIDVEGHEVEVLKGAKETLAKRPSIALEIHCEYWTNRKEQVERIFEIVPIADYEGFIQPKIHGELEAFVPSKHTPEFIASHDNVHLFLSPKF